MRRKTSQSAKSKAYIDCIFYCFIAISNIKKDDWQCNFSAFFAYHYSLFLFRYRTLSRISYGHGLGLGPDIGLGPPPWSGTRFNSGPNLDPGPGLNFWSGHRVVKSSTNQTNSSAFSTGLPGLDASPCVWPALLSFCYICL